MNIKKIREFDKSFRENDRFGDYTRPTFEIFKGDIPVILTAPHTTKTRNLETGKIKKSEIYTGSIVLCARETTGCHAMVRNNFDAQKYSTKESFRENMLLYYKKLSEYIEKYKIQYLIDIHGAILKTPHTVAVGINYGELIFNEDVWKDIITYSFNKYGINTDYESKFQASTLNTISRIINTENKIRTTQFEIDKTLRNLEDELYFENNLNGLNSTIEGIFKQLKRG